MTNPVVARHPHLRPIEPLTRVRNALPDGMPTVPELHLAAKFGGIAATPWALTRGLTHSGGDGGFNYAAIDWWTPPGDAMALTDDLVKAFLRAAEDVPPIATGAHGETYPLTKLDDETLDALRMRLMLANRLWWKYNINDVYVSVRHYTAGEYHREHMEWAPGLVTWKLAAGAQLSDPHDYEGGELRFHFLTQQLVVPRERGTFVAFPGWMNHRVSQITSGERWSLVVNVAGPPFR